MADTDSDVHRFKKALSRYQPECVRVERADGEDLKIKPHGKRGKWQGVVDALPGDPTRAELLDKAGAVMWAMTFAGDEGNEIVSKRVAETDQLLQIVIGAQDHAVKRQNELVESVVKGYANLVDTLSSRLAAMERMFGQTLQLAYDSSVASGEAAAGGGDDEAGAAMKQFISAATPKIMSKVFPDTPKTKPNGAKKGSPNAK